MEIIITIEDEEQISILKKIANNNNLSIEDYASGIVKNWIDKHIRSIYIHYINKEDISIIKSKLGKV